MTKLIDEKLITAACGDMIYSAKNGFRNGVAFAEEKVKPMMVEFAEWLYQQRLNGVDDTTEQLLEQFLNREK
jgi:hypothetical protein